MLKSISLLIITLLLTLSAHAEIKTSIPDFSKSITASLAPIDAELICTNLVPTKTKVIDEYNKNYIFPVGQVINTRPLVEPFQKMVFISQTRTYRSLHAPSFPLLI